MDVCILGRIGYDLYAIEQGRPLDKVEHFSRHVGGSSANIAVGLARLGLTTGIISCVGRDELSPFLLGFLAHEGVDTRHVRAVEGYNTSLCLTEVCPPDGFRQVFYRREPADVQVTLGEAELAYVTQARMFVTNGTSLAASPSRESTMSALRAAHEKGLRVVLDVDYRASSWPSPGEAGRQARAALPWVDLVLGNENEMALLTGTEDPAAQIRCLLDSHVAMVVRKLGARGVEAFTRGQSFSLPASPVAVVSSVGAGDAFAAGFLSALDRGLPAGECLLYGNCAASIVVGRVSCSDAMPYRAELERRVAESHADRVQDSL